MLATSVLAPLSQADYEIVFLTKGVFAPLLQGHPSISSVYSYEKGPDERDARKKFFTWVEKEGFDLILDLHDSWRTWLWRFRLKKIAPVFVAKKPRLREFLILGLRLGRFFSFGQGGRARLYRELVYKALDPVPRLSSDSPLTILSVTDSEVKEIQTFIPEKPFIVFLPVSAWKGKEWPYFSQLSRIVSKKFPIVVLGGEKDLVCDAVAAEAPNGISLRGKTTIRQSMAILSQAEWIIGNDTGMVHVAEALGKKVAMIEGPTHQKMGFSPYGKEAILIGLDLVCRPCSKSGKFCIRFGSRKCLRDLTVERVQTDLKKGGFPC